MKALIFISQPLALIYAAMRCEWVAWAVLFLFLLGAVFLVFYSLYRHLAANGYL